MDPLIVDMSRLSETERKFESRQMLTGSAEESGVSFEELLVSSMKRVNALQTESDEMLRRLAVGDVEDISEVVMAASRAEVALKLFMELRNKFLDAYQQLSRMSA